ncbi:hypothetical protein [Agrobacterium rubi]|nr:hypothetical protein [Agrobacterium rubi]MBP1881584.1 hypothetical protein [Agrobacterium rubi]
MSETFIAALIFCCLCVSSIGAVFVSPKMAVRHRDDETSAVVRLVANIFVVMASLVFGLMINSAKNTYESIDTSVHAFSTNIILLDRSLKTYGIAGKETRDRLREYLEYAIANPARADMTKPDYAGTAIDAVGNALLTIQPSDEYHRDLLLDIRQQYHRLVEQRWSIVENAEGAIPRPLIALLVAWLTLIFGSFGYRAPANAVVVTSFVVGAALISCAFYLVLDMDIPFHGAIQVSDHPLRRALAELTL